MTLIEFSDYRCPLSLVDLELHTYAIGPDTSLFRQCLESGKAAKEIRDDMAEGQKAGVRGTPTFFIGRTNPSSSSVKVLMMLRGAQAYRNFQQALDSLLAAQKSSPDPLK
ncbi:DsbA family protein [Nitrospiraceae bacterium AH_259_D15_M11_P09]|nr:DsbA family protein [Nitrospiraceae bacterium AH_259_D15_M11_P09]